MDSNNENNLNKKIKNARRWYIVFLIMGIVGALNIFTGEALTAYASARSGGIAAVLVHVLSELSLPWFIIAFLSRRQMNKLLREQKTNTSNK